MSIFIGINDEGKIVCENFFYGRNIPAQIAGAMTTKDLEEILIEVKGDFSKLEDNLAKAISLKAVEMAAVRNQTRERQKATRKERSEEYHNKIMAEIKAATQDMDLFFPGDVQKAASEAPLGFPVRTRQTYTVHLQKAVNDGIVQRLYPEHKKVTVVYSNRKIGEQNIHFGKEGYRFIK